MKLNCRPGDLAIVVRDYQMQHTGKIVQVVRLLPGYFSPTWETIPELIDRDGTICDVDDSHLKPIRDPGDEATDESKAWLPPVPTKELA